MIMRKIVAITGARSEYDLMSPLYAELANDPDIDFSIIITGAHLSENFGNTAQFIRRDGYNIADEIHTLIDTNKKIGRLLTAGNQVVAFASAFTRLNPDLLLVAGDREEVISATMSAAFLSMPIAHFFGGDIVKDGNIDNAIRYAAAKFAHLHFVTIEQHKKTLLHLGEPEDRIYVVGSPALDKFQNTGFVPREELSRRIDFDIHSEEYILLIFHPIMTEFGEQEQQISQILDVIKEKNLKVLINYPNSDPGNNFIVNTYLKFVSNYSRAKLFKNLDRETYVNLMRNASCMIGNSSSGLHEAPSVGLPAVNVGSRQRGRLHGNNIIFVDHNKDQIERALEKSLSDLDYREMVKRSQNPYGDGHSAVRISNIIKELPFDTVDYTYKDITYEL